jgi:hypothetical protein
VTPLEHWRLELGENPSGVSWEVNYRPRTPLWELRPIEIRRDGAMLVNMQHIQEGGTYDGWIDVQGERIPVEGWRGCRDRTFGVRAADKIDFWIWMTGQFDDRSVCCYLWETSDGTVQYMDGGWSYVDGTQSERLTRLEHDIEFDGTTKRVVSADLCFYDARGTAYPVAATTDHLDATLYHGMPAPGTREQDGDLSWGVWDATDPEALALADDYTISVDQMLRFEHDGATGAGVFEILAAGEGPDRYPNWAPREVARKAMAAAVAAQAD